MAHKYLLPLSACCHQGYLSRISELTGAEFTFRLKVIRAKNLAWNTWLWLVTEDTGNYVSALQPFFIQSVPEICSSDILLKYPWQSPVVVLLLPPLGPVMMLEVWPQGRGWPRSLPPDPLHALHLPRTDPGTAAGQLPMSLTMKISVGGAAGGVTGVGGDRPGHLHWGVAKAG